MWVRVGSNNSWRRVPKSTNDGLSAPFSITKLQQPATLSRQRSRIRGPSFRSTPNLSWIYAARSTIVPDRSESFL